VRQTAFYEFELRLHRRRREGELSAADIGQIWMDVQAQTLGPVFELDGGYAVWWCYINHFVHVPFYVYAYAFGDCLVNALYAEYQRAPDGFAQKYMQMLSAGGTLRHRDLLAPFGLDGGAAGEVMGPGYTDGQGDQIDGTDGDAGAAEEFGGASDGVGFDADRGDAVFGGEAAAVVQFLIRQGGMQEGVVDHPGEFGIGILHGARR